MKIRARELVGIMTAVLIVTSPLTAYAGWEASGSSYQYRQEDGSYAVSQWIEEEGIFYYLDRNGQMAANTTTPDGYLVAADGSWVTERQALGGYVRTPYDNQPYFYDPDWQYYIFDETTDYAWVTDNHVLAAVRGIIPVTELTEKGQAVYEEVCKFLTGFDYSASDYDKATVVFNKVRSYAAYNWGDYTQEDDEVYSILFRGTGKCVGFARTYKLFANAVGLKCGLRENGAHMWNAVFIDGEARSIDTSGTGSTSESFLDITAVECPECATRIVFGKRDKARSCPNCQALIENPNFS